VAALDFGTKRIGVAISDESKIFAFPYSTITLLQPNRSANSLKDLSSKLDELCMTENVRMFVVGYPMNPISESLLKQGTDDAKTPLGDRIIWTLRNLPQGKCDLYFCMWDESYSTLGARTIANRTSGRRSVFLKHKDSMAAARILQDFLDTLRD
jgi:putative transcription antitermination factor YqgF